MGENLSEAVYIDVAGICEIPNGQGRAFVVDEKSIAVFNCDGEYFAIDDMCPHMGASLAPGHLENCIVSCPWHGWRFDVRDGTWMDNPRVKTDSYPLRVRGTRIEILVKRTVEEKNRKEVKTDPMPTRSSKPAESDAAGGLTEKKTELTLADFQRLIHKMYYEKDVARGVEGTFMWLMEEVGELSTALRERNRKEQLGEFADVLAWLCTIANVCEIDLTAAIQMKYGTGCPGCGKLACICPNSEKP